VVEYKRDVSYPSPYDTDQNLTMTQSEWYDIQCIVDMRRLRNKRIQYLVEWPNGERSWVSDSSSARMRLLVNTDIGQVNSRNITSCAIQAWKASQGPSTREHLEAYIHWLEATLTNYGIEVPMRREKNQG
jgi:hypothetical protein